MAQIEIITREDLQQFKDELIREIRSILKPVQPKNKEWLRSSDVRKMLNISPGTLQSLRLSGKLHFTRVGKIIFYKYQDIILLLGQQ